MRHSTLVGLGIALAATGASAPSFAHLVWANAGATEGQQEKTAPRAVLEADEVFWVPTIDQAVEMAKATGKPIFSMGYSLVPDGTTYTKLGESCPKGVF